MDDKGAGVMAAFGLPPSHDNDPERAVLASMDFCRKIDEVNPHQHSWTMLLMSSEHHLSGICADRELSKARRRLWASRPPTASAGWSAVTPAASTPSTALT